jgi:small nuclear ribonucleoprotein (snRNP)-like protein
MVGQVFLNIVLDDAVEEKDNGEKAKLGMVVRILYNTSPSVG